MANKIFDDVYIQDIADAIRDKNGLSSQQYKVSQMAAAIRAIENNSNVTPSKPEEVKPATIKTNGTHNIFPTDGYTMSQAIVEVQVPQITTTDFKQSFDDNGTYTYEAADGVAYNKIEITIGVDTEGGSDVIDSGSCGANATWKLYDNGELVISGTGEMTNYSSTTSVFYNRKDITSVTIETGVTSIGSYIFRSCVNLTSITIPDSVTSIGANAFMYCKSLTGVTIPNSVTSIQPSAFSNCTGLKSITIPNGISTLATAIFDTCTSLTNVTIPNSVKQINLSAFNKCSKLTGVFYIGTKVQWDDISIANSNDYLKNATLYCAYEEHQCPEGGSNIVDSGKCGDNVDWAVYDNGVLIISGTGATYDYDDNTKIFSEYNITDIIIADGITVIGTSIFSKCKQLKSIVIPNSVTQIKTLAFYAIDGIENLIIPDSVESIGSQCFALINSLRNITCGNTLKNIGTKAFYLLPALENIFYKGTRAEFDATDFGGVDYDDDIRDATLHCEYDESSSGGNSGGNSELAKSIVDKTVTEITADDLNGVTNIGAYTFHSCSSLTNITIPDSVISIGEYAFFDCRSLTEIVIPDSTISIGNMAFYGCKQLTSVILGNNITTIKSNAFYTCTNLSSITIPNSVTTIEDGAFSYCFKIKEYDFTSWTDIPILGTNVFAGIASDCVMKVPAALYNELTTTATNWTAYANYMVPV